MEFGNSAQLQCGGNIIGVSWTTPSHAPMADATQLITTSNTRVQVHAADDQRIVSSWITRPGSANKFSVTVVQHRSSRQLFAVQDGTRLLTWSERQASLDAAITVLVRREVYALRVSKHASAVFVIYRDGGVSVYSLKLEELFYTDGVQAGAGAGTGAGAGGKQAKGKKAQEDGTQPATTWARLTSIPTEPGKLVLLVAVQSSSSVGVPVGPTVLRVFTAVPTKQGSGTGTLPLTFEHKATHQLSPPAGSPPGCRTCSLTLHKHYHALTALWSTGVMQVLRFQKAVNVSAGVQWYTAHPQVVLTRELGTATPGSPAGPSMSPTLRVASFALEPSCLVVAGAGTTSGGQQAVYMTVWDVRYGAILGTKEVAVHSSEGGEADMGAAPSAPAPRYAKRLRSGSMSSTASTAIKAGAAAAALPVQEASPSDIFQVSVNEDGSYVACVSRSGVHVTPVAVRGASLASALGRLPTTTAALHSKEGAHAGQHRAPVLDLDSLLASTVTSASGDGTLTSASAARWAEGVRSGAERVQAEVQAVGNTTTTPTTAAVAGILAKYGVLVQYDEADASLVKGAPGTGRKRARAGSSASLQAASSLPSLSTTQEGNAGPLPYALAVACTNRAVQDLQAGVAAGCTSAAGLGVAAPVLTALLSHHAVSVAACPGLVPALLLAASLPPVEGDDEEEGKAEPNPAAVTSLVLLAEILLHCVDVPETSLVSILHGALHRVAKHTLAGLWGKAAAAAQRAAGVEASSAAEPTPHHVNPSVLGLLYLTALVVRAPRNDVFMEAALATLGREDVRALFAALLRLLHMHANTFVHARPVLSADALEAVICGSSKSKKGKAATSTTSGSAGAGEEVLSVPRESLSMAPRPGMLLNRKVAVPASGSTSVLAAHAHATAHANPLASHLPSYGQVLDWLRMTLDAHFTRVVLMDKADRDTEGSSKSVTMYALLQEVSRVVKGDVALASSAAPVRGHVEHLLKRQPLPTQQEQEYSVGIIRV